MSIRRPEKLLSFLLTTWPESYARLLQVVGEVADGLELPLFVVGGVVRDLLLDKKSPDLDLDLMVEGEAVVLAETLVDRYGGKLTLHPRFHTAKWQLLPEVWQRLGCEQPAGLQSIDLVSARTESYALPAALPKVKPAKLKDDLRRRDFAINAMALRLNGAEAGQFVDHFSGLADLASGVIRMLHSGSFKDDPTRLFRAARFACRFDFPMAAETAALFQPGFAFLSRLSGERVRHEFEAIWREEMPEKTMCFLDKCGLLAALHPDLGWSAAMARSQLALGSHQLALGLPLWISHFTAVIRAELAERWNFPGHWREVIENVAGLVADLDTATADMPAAQAYHLIERWARQDEVIPLVRARLHHQPQHTLLKRYDSVWSNTTPLLNGHDLQRLGIRAGPLYRTILRTLFGKQLDGNLTTKQEAESVATTLAKEGGLSGTEGSGTLVKRSGAFYDGIEGA